MKNTAVSIIIVLLIVVATGFFCYRLGFNNGVADYEAADVTGKVDYPLIELPFGAGGEWVVIIWSNFFTRQETFSIAQNRQELDFNKENLKVMTFPVGRGTTPFGVVYVYKDGTLIKDVPYFELYFKNEIFKKAFQQVTKEKVEDIIKSELPPPI